MSLQEEGRIQGNIETDGCVEITGRGDHGKSRDTRECGDHGESGDQGDGGGHGEVVDHVE